MKYIFISLIRCYQVIPFIGHNMCRFRPTCSQYMIEAIKEYGTFRGIIMGLKRLSKCRPYGGFGYDPVPKKERL
ncbi:MAG: membrane protein insertion efficiency factor YidD [Mollicutes bacterium]|nr:membrane protein insertion efficiency factor YidD [Mollicutes bacterium]